MQDSLSQSFRPSQSPFNVNVCLRESVCMPSMHEHNHLSREFFCKGNTLTERENIEILRKNDRLCIVCVYLVGCVVCFNGLHRVL